MPRKMESLAGREIGKLRVLSSYRKIVVGGKERTQWMVFCDPVLGGCGNYAWMLRDTLVNSKAKTKGCKLCVNKTHGMSNTPEYNAWVNMMQRCYNPKHDKYEDYGGRGIEVEERWHKFENFYADMGPRPTEEHSLDKVSNFDNYGPGNAVWATKYEQNFNRRSN